MSVITDGAVLNVPQAARERASVNLVTDNGGLRTAQACNLARDWYEDDPETAVLDGNGYAVTLMVCIDPAEYELAIVGMLASGPIDVTLLSGTMPWTSSDRTPRFVRIGGHGSSPTLAILARVTVPSSILYGGRQGAPLAIITAARRGNTHRGAGKDQPRRLTTVSRATEIE